MDGTTDAPPSQQDHHPEEGVEGLKAIKGKGPPAVREPQCHFKCDRCDYTSPYKNVLLHHVRTVHEKGRSFKCQFCGKHFSLGVDLQLHVTAAHGHVKDLTCPHQCGFVTAHSSSLGRHMREVHLNIKPKRSRGRAGSRTCDECSYSTNCIRALRRHRDAMHGPVKHYSCDICQDFYSLYQTEIERHKMSFHDKKLDFKCERCPFVASSQSGLEDHKVNHISQLMDDRCEECHLAFLSKESLEAHIVRFHDKALLKERKVLRRQVTVGFKTCDECPYSTKCIRAMKRHKDAMHGQVWHYSCDICNEFYSQYQAEVDRHKMSVHEQKLEFGYMSALHEMGTSREVSDEYGMYRGSAIKNEPPENGEMPLEVELHESEEVTVKDEPLDYVEVPVSVELREEDDPIMP